MANLFTRIKNAIIKDDIAPTTKALPFKFKYNQPSTRSQFQIAGGSSNQVIAQDYDLSVIDRFTDNESIVHQAFSKIQEKATNNGWMYASTDQQAVDYVRQRLREFAKVQKRTTADFERCILADLIKYSNSFWYKYRDPKNSTGKKVRVGDEIYDPISTYVHLDASSVIPERDKYFNVIRYYIGPTHSGQFILDQGIQVKPEDMVHLHFDKSERNNIGMPFIWPCIADIRTLRHMEENLELMIHKHMYPLYQYVVGTETQPTEPEEVEKVIIDIENMPSDGAWVTPNRHEIKVIGAEGKALGIDKYLLYFRERVIMGLGIGLVSFGIGAGGSRASSEVIDRNLVEKAKIYQRRACEWVNDIFIPEILSEGGWDQYTSVQPKVELHFAEIDSDTKIKLENHAANMFNNNGIDYDEFRTRLGEDMKAPTSLSRLFFNMFGPEKIHELTMDEIQATAKASPATAASAKPSSAANAVKGKDQPSNQHGQKLSPKRQRDSIEDEKNPIKSIKNSPNAKEMFGKISKTYDIARQDIMDSIKAGRDSGASVDSSKQGVGYAMGLTGNSIYQASRAYVAGAWDNGYSHGYNGGYITDSNTMRLKANEVLDLHNEYIHKTLTNLGNDVITILADNKDDMINRVSAVFDLYKHYIHGAIHTSISKAFNYGKAHGFKDLGHQVAYSTADPDTKCKPCLEQNGKPIDLTNLTVHSIAPHHQQCNCTIELQGEDSGQS